MERSDLAADAAPERIVAAVAANVAGGTMPHGSPEGAHPGAVSVRTAEHAGHAIVVRTHYEIEVDGRPFSPHLVVDNSGRVHYHGLPTRDFASMVELVRKAIDTFPEDFPEPDGRQDPPHHSHGSERGRDAAEEHGTHPAGSTGLDGATGRAPEPEHPRDQGSAP